MNHDHDDFADQNSREALGCAEYLPHLSELLRGKATKTLLDGWNDHRAICSNCEEQWQHLQRLMSAWSQLPLNADPRSSWSGIRAELDREQAELEKTLAPYFAAYRQRPPNSSPDRVWKRIQAKTRPQPVLSWARMLDVTSLLVAAGWLFCLLIRGNDAALELARRWIPDADWLASLAATPFASLFLPATFALFSGAVALVSLPLLLRAAERDSIAMTTEHGKVLRSGGAA